MLLRKGYTSHPDKSLDEMRKCVGATIAFMAATSAKFYSVSSFENPSRYWVDLIPAD
jgi:hypothetical protein